MTKDYDPESPEALACRSQPVGIDTLHSSPTNPRTSFGGPDDDEFIASVRTHGVIEPIIARPWPEEYAWVGTKPLYEIVCGERRFRAAQVVGLKLLPVLIRELTTAQVLEFQMIENLQRKDLHPLDEAEGYELMMRDYGYTADQLADKIGKSRSYVFGRTKLLQLDDDARRLFRGGVLNASTALLIARIPTAKLRAKAIKEITEKDYNGDTMSVRHAQRYLQDRFMLRLASASFPTDDATLCGGSCVDCQKRTGNQPHDLFEDVDSPDVCTDPDCFAIKRNAFMQREAAKAKDKGIEVITGKAAAKIAPHGLAYSSPDDYVKLDATCYEDRERRTYREILGDEVEQILVEDVQRKELVPLVKNTILADKLKEAGIASSADKHAKDRERREAKVELERQYRDRLFSSIRTEMCNATLDGEVTLTPEAALTLLRAVLLQLWRRTDSEAELRVLKLWEPPGKNVAERKTAMGELILTLNAGDAWRLLVDLLLAGDCYVSEYFLDREPEKLLGAARLFNVDPAEVRKDVVSERREQARAEKKAKSAVSTPKKPAKSARVPAAEASPPTKAAPAAEKVTTDGEFTIGDRVRVKNDVRGRTGKRRKCCGREGTVEGFNPGGAYIHVRFDDGSLVTNLVWNELDKVPLPTEAARAAEANGETAPADAGIIETNETPSAPAKGQAPYVHPDNASLTWSGRGRRPSWLVAWLAEGKTLADLAEVA